MYNDLLCIMTDCLIHSLDLLPQDASNSIVVCYLHSQCKSIKSRTKPAQVLFLGYNGAVKKFVWIHFLTFTCLRSNKFIFSLSCGAVWVGCEAAGPTQVGSSCTRFFVCCWRSGRLVLRLSVQVGSRHEDYSSSCLTMFLCQVTFVL